MNDPKAIQHPNKNESNKIGTGYHYGMTLHVTKVILNVINATLNATKMTLNVATLTVTVPLEWLRMLPKSPKMPLSSLEILLE